MYFIIVSIISVFVKNKTDNNQPYEPKVSFIIAAYNEEQVIPEKLINTRSLDYPSEKLEIIWVTDGSNDQSVQLLSKEKSIIHLHSPERLGKVNAMNKAVTKSTGEILIFSDANSILSANSVKELINEYKDPKTGCVAGNKQVIDGTNPNPSISEGIYWQLESKLKNAESKIKSTIGAAGELFSVKREFFQPVEDNTILDDFVIAMQIALMGYRVKFAPNAIATETKSFTINDEMKRKIRIAAGGFQVLFRLKKLSNPFRFPLLFFMFWSHKVSRWLLVPISLIGLFITNLLLLQHSYPVFLILLLSQIMFYLIAIIGYLFKSKTKLPKLLFLPFYFTVSNYCQLLGLYRFIRKNQSVNWEKAKRA